MVLKMMMMNDLEVENKIFVFNYYDMVVTGNYYDMVLPILSRKFGQRKREH